VSKSDFVIEAVDDPTGAGPIRDQIERGRRNMEWLSNHWEDVLPRARGRFLAVAGQEAHMADSPDAAWAWAQAAHPEDDGALVQFVPARQGPRIYAHRRHMVQSRYEIHPS
jgi:hypothetical protein